MRDSVPSPRYSPFVMYCVNGKPRSSILIESIDSMIITDTIVLNVRCAAILNWSFLKIVLFES